ncbi:MAG: protein kinase [archaeon]|nr:protein kinase [archaeon]
MPFELTERHRLHIQKKHYRGIQLLGVGEYAGVVAATRSRSHSAPRVALKVSEHFDSFCAELMSLNVLGAHPNIVSHKGSFSDRFIHVIELEYLSGLTLLDVLMQSGRMPEEAALHWFVHLLAGMAHAHHEARVAHRDVKAENLLICDGKLVIIDWGMAVPFQPNQYRQECCSSPDYAAPELYLGLPHQGPEIDVWSMGVVLYAMVTATFPFPGTTPSHLAELITRSGYRNPPDVSPQLLDLISHMLDKDRRTRITVAQIAEHPWVREAYGQYVSQIPATLPSKAGLLAERPSAAPPPLLRSSSMSFSSKFSPFSSKSPLRHPAAPSSSSTSSRALGVTSGSLLAISEPEEPKHRPSRFSISISQILRGKKAKSLKRSP